MLTQAEIIERNWVSKRMPEVKIQCILKELPWLQTWLRVENEKVEKCRKQKIPYRSIEIEQIYISRIEPCFFDLKPIRCKVKSPLYERSGDTFEITTDLNCFQEEIHFLGADGNVVTYQGQWRWPVDFFLSLFGKKPKTGIVTVRLIAFPGESCGEKMAYLGPERIDSIRYVVSYLAYTKALIIYKPPQDVSVMQCLKDQAAQHTAQIEAEVKAEIAETN